MMIGVLLCDDHMILRDGLRNLLNAESDIQVVGEASDGLEAIERVHSLNPDVVLMDINMPKLSGVDTVERLCTKFPALKVIMLTMFNHDEYLFRSIRAGARGYLLKDSPIRTVVDAIRNVMDGVSVLHPDLTHKLLDSYRLQKSPEEAVVLSPREQEVLTALVKGLSNKEIAESLFISETTVKLHTSHIYRKLGVKSRSQAVMHAVRHKLVEVS